MIKWEEKRFEELSANELYEIFKIRAEIFVLEQEIAYVDPDNKDQKAIHIIGRKNGMNEWTDHIERENGGD